MSVATDTDVVSLRASCWFPSCLAFAMPLLEQLATGAYDVCSVLPLDEPEEWRHAHRTARRRSARSERLGYRFAPIERHKFADDVFAINTSLARRQGRPMTAGYRERPSETADVEWPCPWHRVNPYGVLLDETLVAYAYIYRSGELALVSQILGHGDHLRNDVMYLLGASVVEAESRLGGFLVYNRHDSGTDGLRYFKERLGFAPRSVEWRP